MRLVWMGWEINWVAAISESSVDHGIDRVLTVEIARFSRLLEGFHSDLLGIPRRTVFSRKIYALFALLTQYLGVYP